MSITLGELLEKFDGQSYNTKVIFSVDGDYDTGVWARDYSNEKLEKEVGSWTLEYEEFVDRSFGYEALINVKVWTK